MEACGQGHWNREGQGDMVPSLFTGSKGERLGVRAERSEWRHSLGGEEAVLEQDLRGRGRVGAGPQGEGAVWGWDHGLGTGGPPTFRELPLLLPVVTV